MKRTITALTLAASLAACTVETLDDYRPVTDPGAKAASRYEADLSQCRQIAKAAEADYQRRQNEQLAANLIGGILLGAVVGAAIGDSGDWAAYGAASGAASGVAATDFEGAHGGPRRIVDRCMSQRGHAVLSDLGRG